MDLISLAILAKIGEYGELSIKELKEILDIESKLIIRKLSIMEKKGFIERKAFIYGDIIYGITEKGMDELYRHYIVLRDLIPQLEEILCTQYEC